MSEVAQRQLDSVSEFVAAVEYVAVVDRPALTIWEALAEALRDWLGDHAPDERERDSLRRVLIRLIEMIPEDGVPGGHQISEVVDASVGSWAERQAERLNDGLPFRAVERRLEELR